MKMKYNLHIIIFSLFSFIAYAKKSIPQSKHSILYHTHPAWNHSPQIDSHGFLSKKYKLYPGKWERDARIGGKYGFKSKHTKQLKDTEVVIRQVPGDGNCLFHSLSTALSWVEDRVHLDFDESFKGKVKKKHKLWNHDSHEEKDITTCEELDLHARSKILREIAVDMLQPNSVEEMNVRKPRFLRRKRKRSLFLQGSEFLRPEELLSVACSQYDLTGEEYCEQMMQDGVWGGGIEIVALVNYLKRPIHVFELMTMYPKQRTKKRKRSRNDDDEDDLHEPSPPEFRLRRMACFGSPKFDYREPLCILSADCRFPDLVPGQQASAGNHFMAIFPLKKGSRKCIKNQPFSMSDSNPGVRVRSGGVVRPARGDSTFSRRDVLARYFYKEKEDKSMNPLEHLFGGKLSSFLNRKEEEVVEKDVEVSPFDQIRSWCMNKCNDLKAGFQY